MLHSTAFKEEAPFFLTPNGIAQQQRRDWRDSSHFSA
jgi:hypothetical protein